MCFHFPFIIIFELILSECVFCCPNIIIFLYVCLYLAFSWSQPCIRILSAGTKQPHPFKSCDNVTLQLCWPHLLSCLLSHIGKWKLKLYFILYVYILSYHGYPYKLVAEYLHNRLRLIHMKVHSQSKQISKWIHSTS